MFNRSQKISIGKPRIVKAYQLFQPYIKLYNNNIVKNHQDGSMMVRDRLKQVENFKDWVVVYSLGKNPKFDDKDADALIDVLNQASPAFGIKMNEPGFITCDSSIASWK